MKTLLITAFEPFGGQAINPAQWVLDSLQETYAGMKVEKLLLPTVFGLASTRLIAALDSLRPAGVLMLGQAGGRQGITIERVAINVDDAELADNAGNTPEDLPIVAGGPAAYFASLPIKAMVAAIRAAGLDAAISNTAGTFVCNHVLYAALHHLAIKGRDCQAGFLHLPWLPEQVQGKQPVPYSMGLAQQVQAVEAALRVIMETD